MEGGKAKPGYEWENAIDDDIWGANSYVFADKNDAWAVFHFADSMLHQISKLRLLTDSAEPNPYITDLVKEYEVLVSLDGQTYTSAYKGVSVKVDGEWDLVTLPTPVDALYLKLVILSPRHPLVQNVKLVEFQVFGADAASMAKSGLEASEGLPADFSLRNYPNPFNPETRISFGLPEAAQVSVAIYNMQGQLIRALVNEYRNAGSHEVIWNARDENGSQVAGGIYIYKLSVTGETKKSTLTKKMVLMK